MNNQAFNKALWELEKHAYAHNQKGIAEAKSLIEKLLEEFVEAGKAFENSITGIKEVLPPIELSQFTNEESE